MKTVRILCEFKDTKLESEIKELTAFTANQFNETHETKVDIDVVEPYQVLDKLCGKDKYDIVILHVGLSRMDGTYRQADRVREIFNGMIVGESTLYPEYPSEDIILKHFDAYIDRITNEGVLQKLVESYLKGIQKLFFL